MRTNLHDIGRFDDRLSFLYVDRAVIKHTENAIAIHEFDGKTEVPVASLALLMLGPGTSITHEAIKSLADNNCLTVWAGELGIRYYACGMGGARHSRNLLRQARLAADERSRLQVVIRMYCARFVDDAIDPDITLQQLRGKEGVRVRQAYAEASKATGIPWEGRTYKREEWYAGNTVNRALSAANACLYGLVHAAIISAGYSPAIGFIHTGKQLSFVYDVADLYKAELTIPLAFELAAKDSLNLEREVREESRRRFHAAKLLQRIIPDIRKCLKIEVDEADEYVNDPSKPAELWTPVSGGDVPIRLILSPRDSEDRPASGGGDAA